LKIYVAASNATTTVSAMKKPANVTVLPAGAATAVSLKTFATTLTAVLTVTATMPLVSASVQLAGLVLGARSKTNAAT